MPEYMRVNAAIRATPPSASSARRRRRRRTAPGVAVVDSTSTRSVSSAASSSSRSLSSCSVAESRALRLSGPVEPHDLDAVVEALQQHRHVGHGDSPPRRAPSYAVAVATAMSDEERRAFLSAGTRTGILSTVRRDGRPHAAPIWFVLDGDDIVFTTAPTPSRAATCDAPVRRR